MEWIRCDDKLPEEGKRVLLWLKDPEDSDRDKRMKIGSLRYGRLIHDGAGGNWHDSYSHWALPEPPSDDMQQQQHQHDQEDAANSEATAVSKPRTHAEPTNAKH